METISSIGTADDTAAIKTSSRAAAAAIERREKVESIGVAVMQLTIALILFGLWEWGAQTGWISTFLFGSPSAVLSLAWTRIQNGSLFYGAYVTGIETLAGFVIGSVLGTALGLGLWYSRFVARVASVFILAVGSVPVLALGPLIIIWVGVQDHSRHHILRHHRTSASLRGCPAGRQRPNQTVELLRRQQAADLHQGGHPFLV